LITEHASGGELFDYIVKKWRLKEECGSANDANAVAAIANA